LFSKLKGYNFAEPSVSGKAKNGYSKDNKNDRGHREQHLEAGGDGMPD
jgi:hypothetical protein